MFYSTVVIAAAAFSGLVAAQSGNSTITIDPNSVPSTLRQTWCRAQLQTCPQLCPDQRTTAGGNTCDVNTLEYSCVCASDNQSPDVADYEQTLPGQLCRTYVSQCVIAHPDDAEGIAACRSTNCGNKTVEEATSSLSSESSSATSSSTRSASGSGASETASSTSGGEASSTASQSASATADSGAASGLNIASTGVLAVGILAAFGFAL